MKLHYLLLPLGIIAIAWFAIGIYQANSAPPPFGKAKGRRQKAKG